MIGASTSLLCSSLLQARLLGPGIAAVTYERLLAHLGPSDHRHRELLQRGNGQGSATREGGGLGLRFRRRGDVAQERRRSRARRADELGVAEVALNQH